MPQTKVPLFVKYPLLHRAALQGGQEPREAGQRCGVGRERCCDSMKTWIKTTSSESMRRTAGMAPRALSGQGRREAPPAPA